MNACSDVDGTGVADTDIATVTEQLGRRPRGMMAVSARCASGHPNVVKTLPRLPEGTPFPTLYYVTCPTLTARIGTLEASGLMHEMGRRLAAEPELAAAYRRAHEAYLAERADIEVVPEIAGISAGGMPTRVKCLHALVGHSLAAGLGVNPLGDEAIRRLGDWWTGTPCAAE